MTESLFDGGRLVIGKMFKKGKELLDANFTEFLVTGYTADGQRHSFIEITCDGKKQKERLKVTIRGVKYINKLLDGIEREDGSIYTTPSQIPICPGILLVVDQHCKKPMEKIDVEQLIDETDAENNGNPTELRISGG